MKTLFEIRRFLVVATQAEYDRRIAAGFHPYSMASYHFEKVFHEELSKHVDTADWKLENWRRLQAAIDPECNTEVDLSKGRWAVAAILNSIQAWATPGFSEAYHNHCLENN